MIAEPDDPATGHVPAQVGGVQTLALIESDDPIRDGHAEAMLRRERLAVHLDPGLVGHAAEAEGVTVMGARAAPDSLCRSPAETRAFKRSTAGSPEACPIAARATSRHRPRLDFRPASRLTRDSAASR